MSIMRPRNRVEGWLYRAVMRFAHRHNWHYATKCYPDGDTMLWCQWCGFRQVVHRGKFVSSLRAMQCVPAKSPTGGR